MKLTYEKSWYLKTETLVADSCTWGKRWLLRAPDNFSSKLPPPSATRLIDSAGHRAGSGAVLLSSSPAKLFLPSPTLIHPGEVAELGEKLTEKLQADLLAK